MKNRIQLGGLFLALLLMVAGCGNDTPTDDQETVIDEPIAETPAPDIALTEEALTGYWNVEKAWRDGKHAASLDDAFFEFGDSNSMITNILGEAEEHQYVLDGEHIHQKSEFLNIDYMIEEYKDSVFGTDDVDAWSRLQVQAP